MAWRLINHLSLNYLTLMDSNQTEGAAALRELLTLYADPNDATVRKQIEGVLSVASKNVVRRVDTASPISRAASCTISSTALLPSLIESASAPLRILATSVPTFSSRAPTRFP